MSARREERKVLTCMFCDLVGFTSRAESMDPEDVAAVLRGYHEHVRGELERYGGTVEKFIGDAVMALFGAPVAHEDDPERAVRAALAIRDWAREQDGLQVRIGITTGEALVSLDASPERGEGMASGDVVNTASRLQTAAPENEIVVDETTYHATADEIGYDQADPVAAKGKAEPITVWRALQARAVVGIELRPETPLVGREHERAMLVDALERVRRESEPQLVTIVGVPGIGKSRLVAELFAEVERDPELINWRHGRSLPYGEGVVFWAFAEMVKAQAGILESDGAEGARTKLHEAVAAAVGEDSAWIESRLQPLLALGEGGGDRDESFAAWRQFVEALAEQRPTVLVFEDLQWADDDLLDFVDHLVDWSTGVALLVVATARPELLDRRQAWGGGKRNAVSISLPPLGNDETARLIASLLDRPVLPAETQEALLARAGGNPLYAEQFARMLAERGDAGELPETVQGIIAARLDALPPEEKALLQDASVVGKVFWLGALETIADVERREAERILHALERKEFVRRDRRSSVAGETEHAFAHLLVQDVAYGQIPRAERADKHSRAARWLESVSPDRSEDRAEMLAYHYRAAIELGQAAGQDVSDLHDPARSAFIEAGDRGLALHAHASAERFYSAALELLPEGSGEWAHVIVSRQSMRLSFDDDDARAMEKAIESLLALGVVEAAADAQIDLALDVWNSGDSAGGQSRMDRALALLGDVRASPAKARALAQRSRLSMLARQKDDALRLGQEALAIAEELGLDELRATVLTSIGPLRVSMGDMRGFDDLDRGREIALAVGSPTEIHRAYNNLVESLREVGDWRKAAEVLAENRRIDEQFGIRASLLWLEAEEALQGYHTGDWDLAERRARSVIGESEAGASLYVQPVCRNLRSLMRLARGDGVGALEDCTRALELARGSDPQVHGSVAADHAFVLLSLGEREEASRLADESLAVPTYFHTAVNLAWTLHDLGRGDEFDRWAEDLTTPSWRKAGAAIATGDPVTAAAVLGEMGDVADEAYARLRSGLDAEVRRALEFYRSVGAMRYVREGESLLAASA